MKKQVKKDQLNEDRVRKSEDSVGVNILIRKYENRRLYCVNTRKYVTLDEIKKWVQNGKTVRVTDVVTDDDITSEIFVQILLQEGKVNLIPIPTLELMIRMNNVWLKKFWNPFFEKSIKLGFEMNPLLNPDLAGTLKNWFK